jgi:hypothetical protein
MLQVNISVSPLCMRLCQQIRKLIQLEREVKIQHTYYEAKMCSDTLANIRCCLGFILSGPGL